MTKFKFGDKVNCIHGVGIVTITYFDYEFDEFICEVVFILDGKTCTYKSLENELTKVSEWIPCSERMPEDDSEVIVTDGNYVWRDKCYDFGDGLCFYDDNDSSATHWMPLPYMPEVTE